MSYSRNNPSTPKIREVAIKSVDVVNHSASAVNRFSSTNVDNINNPGNQVFIDTSYYVGATQVQPAPGEQWMIQQINGQWRLHSRISYNDPNQQIEPTAGQHIVGSGNGPVELQGSQINVGGPLAVAAYTTATLPSASSVPAGTHVYDTSLGMPVWSNGTLWTDASGTPLPTLVAPAGIPSTEAFGIPTIGLSVLPSGIASAAALGTPTVTPGPVNISPTGIATGEAFGTPTVFLAPTFDAVGVGGNNNGTSNPGL
ncbi:MAG TPA: hypothetical protein VH164_13235, partial [Ktedonobacteraceae bacterium]|nr:hypothetical protein [Ktedonobacteraceae bacterium]